MKKFGLIISALALVAGLSQCTKRPNLPSWNGSTQTVEFTTSHNGGAKGELIDATTILNYRWDINDEDGNGKTDMLYVYAQDGGTTFSEGVFVGTLPIVEVSADGYEATFRAKLNVPASGVLRFVHYGQGVNVDENGVASVDFSNQKGTLAEISKYVVAKYDGSYTGEPIFNKCTLEVQFAVAKLKFSKFGSGDIRISGMESTGLNVTTTGKINYNNKTATNLTKPGTNEFYTVFMPKASTNYMFTSATGKTNKEWELKVNEYYTKDDATQGLAILVEKTEDPAGTPTVETKVGCYGCLYNIGGVVTSTPTPQVCEYGVVYAKKSENNKPTYDGDHCHVVIANTGVVGSSLSFNVDLPTLEAVDYSIRAYVIGENGVKVHAETVVKLTGGDAPVSVTWNGGGIPNASPATYKVSDTKSVRFAHGNLQFHTTNKVWRFASSQAEVCDVDTKNPHTTTSYAENTNTWIDLFGWGTTGYLDTRKDDNTRPNYPTWYQKEDRCYPYSTSISPLASTTYNNNGYGPDYYSGGPKYDLTLVNKSDWGFVMNTPAENENNTGWRTLSAEEWSYLAGRESGSLCGLCKIGNCATGVIILPDDFNWNDLPAGFPEFKPFVESTGDFDDNTYLFSQWYELESRGVLLLPSAGYRTEGSSEEGPAVSIANVNKCGYYWSTSCKDAEKASYYSFKKGLAGVPSIGQPRYYGKSVRLVRDAE